LYMLVCFPMGS